jgi:hypothetical protein
MLAIKNNIVENAIIIYEDDLFANQLMNGIKQSETFEEFLLSFKNHSKAVYNNETASDYLNGCDSDESPLSLFVNWLIKPKNEKFYTTFLDTICNEKDYNENEWIIQEINMLLWTNPVEYVNAFESFIKHPIMGSYFSFWSAIWVDSEYYLDNGLDLKEVDTMYVKYFTLYKTYYESKPVSRFRYEFTTITNVSTNKVSKKRNFFSPFTFSQYVEEVKSDLNFRKLTEKKLPKLYELLN